MPARPGDTFTLQAPPYHRHVVLTSPDEAGEVIVVNFTTITPIHDDQGCILQPADYPEFVRQPTTMRFNKARMLPADKIEPSDRLRLNEPVSAATLLKIQKAGIDSDFLAGKFKRLLQDELGLEEDEP